MKKAYGYYRYSSHNQDGGNSINAQRNAVREFAKANNIEIVSEYVDKACSGTTPYRNGYQKMLSDLEKNPDVKYYSGYRKGFTYVLINHNEGYGYSRSCP